VIYGHVATSEIQWVNNTLCIDTGCVYGGRLTALRWPEKDIASVPAAKMYYEPSRPLATAGEAVLARLRTAVDRIGGWEDLATDWLLLDTEIMPWSAKAGALIDNQYAPVAISSRAGLTAANDALARAAARGVPVEALQARFTDRAARAEAYSRAWAPYVWPVSGVDDLRVAPFHLLASEGRVWFDRDHVWHMQFADRLAGDSGTIVTKTHWKQVALGDEAACAEAAAWWEDRTTGGGEGMVVKPREFVTRGPKGLLQPALKVRGREYLRIIYGPEYDAPDNLVRLRERGLAGKRNLAIREFALGHEGLKRFVAREPLRRVHECVFAVLALESEPIDPRL